MKRFLSAPVLIVVLLSVLAIGAVAYVLWPQSNHRFDNETYNDANKSPSEGPAQKKNDQSRNNTSKQSSGSSGVSTVSPKSGWRAELEQCKTSAGINIIKREQCVWAYCKGRWGQAECPPEGGQRPTNY